MMQPAAADPQQQQQQPWVVMQYPSAAMVMQHQMMAAPPPPPQFAQQFFPYPPPTPQHHHPPPSVSSDENKKIWVGDLHYWMDESYLHTCFCHTGELVNCKVIRNKHSGQSEGYGFVEFYSHGGAEKVLQSFGAHLMPNTDQPFRLNWASFSMGDRRSDTASDNSIFVGDLASDVTDGLLQETFSSKYSSVKGAKVVIDAVTGRSKGYDFVRFGNDNEKTLAMTEMNGVFCSSRPMRIGAATPRKSSESRPSLDRKAAMVATRIPEVPSCNRRRSWVQWTSAQGFQSDSDSTNTTVFVGGLDPNVNEDELRQSFSHYGEIASVKIPVGKQCGFVQFVNRNNAEDALQALNGTVIGKQTVRLSWGRNPANKQLRADAGNQWNGVYYGGHVYDGYGYAVPPHDPSLYAAAYGAYPLYVNQPQVS